MTVPTHDALVAETAAVLDLHLEATERAHALDGRRLDQPTDALVAEPGGQQQLDYASLVDLKTGEVVWFNVVRAGSQVLAV